MDFNPLLTNPRPSSRYVRLSDYVIPGYVIIDYIIWKMALLISYRTNKGWALENNWWARNVLQGYVDRSTDQIFDFQPQKNSRADLKGLILGFYSLVSSRQLIRSFRNLARIYNGPLAFTWTCFRLPVRTSDRKLMSSIVQMILFYQKND